ncbi:MAG: type II toxin-antitoxin system RelE/ParE family toxin [Thermoanaerobaculia bacterium]
MARTVRWTEAATRDLEEAAEFIAKDSRFYAMALVREAREAARSLKRLAERGRVVPEARSPEIRELFVKSYRLVYKIDPQIISIVAFVHGARDLSRIWPDE